MANCGRGGLVLPSRISSFSKIPKNPHVGGQHAIILLKTINLDIKYVSVSIV